MSLTPPLDSTPANAAAEPLAADATSAASAASASASQTPALPWWQSRPWALALLAVAGLALVIGLLLWQKISNIQEELARRSNDAGAQAVEARTLARQAQQTTQDFAARLASTEARLSEVSLQRSQLEELMQSLSRSRDENLVVDIEAALRLAQQQAQLTGSAEPLLAALKSAEQRLQRAAQPRLSPLQRALAKDAERIKSTVVVDIPALLIRLDELTRLLDELPVANAMLGERGNPAPVKPASEAPPADTAAVPPPAAPPSWVSAWRERLATLFSGLFSGIGEEARNLLRVSRIDRPEAALVSPEQSFFLRENLKLKLLNARLGLLSRQNEVARSDLQSVQSALERYFDGSSRKTQAALALLQQVQVQLKSNESPRLDQSLTALATAAGGR